MFGFFFFFPLLHPHCPPCVCEPEDGNDGQVGRAPEGYACEGWQGGCRVPVVPYGLVPAGLWGLPRQPRCVCGQGSRLGHSLLFLLPTRWLLSERWLSAGASRIPRQRRPRAVSLSPQPRGIDRAASGSMAGFARPGRGLRSAPRFPRMARAGSVC